MKLQIEKNLENSIYSSEFSLIDKNEFDEALLKDYAGTTELQVGFNIMELVSEDDGTGQMVEKEVLLLAQPTKYVPFAGALPIAKAWNIAQYAEKTEKIAINYNRMLSNNILELVAELKTKGDSYTGVEEILL